MKDMTINICDQLDRKIDELNEELLLIYIDFSEKKDNEEYEKKIKEWTKKREDVSKEIMSYIK